MVTTLDPTGLYIVAGLLVVGIVLGFLYLLIRTGTRR